MKKLHFISLLLAAILLILPLSGCGKKGVTLDDLKPTDTLVLYIPEKLEHDVSLGWFAMDFVEPYRALYGDEVKVQLVTIPGGLEEYEERVTNDVLSGDGPDILFMDMLPSLDVEKAARNDSFLDLTDLMMSDPEFHEEDYIEGVMDAVKIDGRQYTVPLTYIPPVYVSDQTKLDELGFSWDEIRTTSDFMEELARLTPIAAQNAVFRQMLESKNCFGELFRCAGIPLLDYDAGSVLPDEAAFAEFMRGYKVFFPFDYDASEAYDPWVYRSPAVAQGSIVFFSEVFVQMLSGSISRVEENPSAVHALGSVPGQNGGTVGVIGGQIAVSAASKNVLNAWRFVKLMLSEDIQWLGRVDLNVGSPVNKAAVERSVYRGCSFLPEEERESIVKQYTELDRFVWKTSDIAINMTWDAMMPYFRDEKSYDDCLAELKSKLSFYLSE